MISNQIKVGEVLSETSFYKVVEITNDKVILSNDGGIKVSLGKSYVDNLLTSADYYESEEKKTMTELAELFINSSRIAITVCFRKTSKAKTKKEFNAEKEALIERFKNAKYTEIESIVNDLINNPLSDTIPGELRVMRGRHYGNVDDLGRVSFIDMELDKDTSKDYDTRIRQVDPRTIQYLIVNKVKYILK